MKALFVHQNGPGQFRHLAPALSRDSGNEVVFISQPGKPKLPGVRHVTYSPHRKVSQGVHGYLASTEAAVLNAQAVARACFDLKKQGFVPDVMIGNPGWGETLFLKDVWPDAALISLSEFFYRGHGSDIGFDPEFPASADTVLRARIRSGPHLLALDAADAAYSPTHWQKAQFPSVYHDRIQVIHDGIDVDRVAPNDAATFRLPNGRVLSGEDEVLTYVARNLEPYRGFHTFMRALPEILERRPAAQVVVVGGDGVSYGRAPDNAGSWRDVMCAEIGPLPKRVAFTGRIPYTDYLSLLQVSSAHVYLTYPFVLSWSMLEAMASGCVVIGSATQPVQEVIDDGRNGYLTDFFDINALVDIVVEVLSGRQNQSSLRNAARSDIIERYSLNDCLTRQRTLIQDVVSGQ